MYLNHRQFLHHPRMSPCFIESFRSADNRGRGLKGHPSCLSHLFRKALRWMFLREAEASNLSIDAFQRSFVFVGHWRDVLSLNSAPCVPPAMHLQNMISPLMNISAPSFATEDSAAFVSEPLREVAIFDRRVRGGCSSLWTRYFTFVSARTAQ